MPLTHVDGRVIISCDLQSKNWHTFESGEKIRLERQFDNFNRRYTEATNAVVISAEGIPIGSEILIHPNAVDETNRITNYRQLSGNETSSDIKYYSILPDQCFIFKDEQGNWKPLQPYETALKVFRPYSGVMVGIEPAEIKDCLYVTSGDLEGLVVLTVKAADYCVIFQGSDGKEDRLIRFRPHGCAKTNREPEAIAVQNEFTELVNEGKLLIGLSPTDCKPKEIHAYAD